ncbi:hypothetical protein ACQ4M3_30720 [Leptolyngbya sp. AN03gr2]|uniref:hypothetical protein n=1 Tax=unclassified Leptolyngbya TaxID=2650499 RepID=UPI003D3167F0
MAFTVSPTEAQAMQEDQAQLLSAIAQATRGMISALDSSRAQQSDPPKTMRIQMGRRLIYGQMARGEFRNELTPDRLKTIFDALQRPVTEDVNPKKYQGKIPAIEIKDGDTVLFREESDGIVTVNQIAFQIQRQNQTDKSRLDTENTNTEKQKSETEKLQPRSNVSEQRQQLQQAQQLRVLGQSALDLQGVTTATGNRQYQSKNFTIIENAENDTLTIASQDKTVLQTTREGQILVAAPNEIPTALSEIGEAYKQAEELQWRMESNEPPPEDLSLDWQAQNIQAQDIANTAQFLLNPLGDEKPLYDTVAISDYKITQDTDGLTITRGNDELVLIVREGQVWDYGSTGKDWETFQRLQPQRAIINEQEALNDRVDLTADFTPVLADGENMLPAIAVAQREAAKLPDGATKQLLQSTHQNWKQQVLQGLGQGVRETMNWLSSRPETMRDQSIARSSLELFHRSHLRTSEKSYEMGDFKVSLQGMNLYTISDANGELMRFKATKSPIPGLQNQSIQILSKSDRLTSTHQAVFQQMRQDKSLTPVGELDVEARYGAKTQRVEQTVRVFLNSQNARVWDKEKGRFKFEIGEDNFIKITDKRDGRGVVYRRDNGRVMSRLQPNDFAHFDRLADQLQSAERQQDATQEKTRSNQKQSSGMELS